MPNMTNMSPGVGYLLNKMAAAAGSPQIVAAYYLQAKAAAGPANTLDTPYGMLLCEPRRDVDGVWLLHLVNSLGPFTLTTGGHGVEASWNCSEEAPWGVVSDILLQLLHFIAVVAPNDHPAYMALMDHYGETEEALSGPPLHLIDPSTMGTKVY